MRHDLLVGAAIAVLLQAAAPAEAATCMDELDRFERRLHSSSLAATDPDAFEALVRQAEETAELRDEEQCLQNVAELNAALPDDAGLQPTSRRSAAPGGEKNGRDNPRRPAAPMLKIAGSDDADETPEEEPTKTTSGQDDENDTAND